MDYSPDRCPSPRPARTALGGTLGRLGVAAAAAVLLVLLGLPLAALVLRITPDALWSRLGQPLVLDALRLSLVTSAASTAAVVALGLPMAYLLATRGFPGKRVVLVLIDLPLVLPPTVAGVALLAAFGRAGLAGGVLRAFGVTLPFTTLGVSSPRPSWRCPSSSGPPAPGSRRWTGATSTWPRRSAARPATPFCG
jgi:molybdate transport system permease protein